MVISISLPKNKNQSLLLVIYSFQPRFMKEKNYLIHPSYIILFLLLAGITALFLGFSGAYIYTRFQNDIPPIKLPWLFYVNTLLLIGSSLTLKWAKTSYKHDKTENYKRALKITLGLSIFFLIAQFFAWGQLQASDIFINHSNMASYMYIISGVHFAHVVLGIPFLIMFIINAVRNMKEPVSVLIYFSDKMKERRLNLFNIYWHYLDFLWIYLVLFFLINYIIG